MQIITKVLNKFILTGRGRKKVVNRRRLKKLAAFPVNKANLLSVLTGPAIKGVFKVLGFVPLVVCAYICVYHALSHLVSFHV